MYLSDLKNIANFKFDIINDGEFQTLGAVDSKNSELLVAIYDPNFVQHAIDKENVRSLIVKKEFLTKEQLDLLSNNKKGLIFDPDPHALIFKIHQILATLDGFYWKNFQREIGENCTIDRTAVIAEKNVRIGNNCQIAAHCVIEENAIIGDNVVLHPGVVVSCEGFYIRKVENKNTLLKHTGSIEIEDHVEVLANSCLAKAKFSEQTLIKRGTKIDTLSHIAHGVLVGEECIICSSVIVCGSVEIGDKVWIGPNTTISDHIKIGDKAYITLGSIVKRDIPAEMALIGNNTISLEQFQKLVIAGQ